MEQILKREFRGGASGDVSFSPNGDPNKVKFDFINLQAKTDVEFVRIGSWVQTQEQYEHCIDTELCGVLNIEDESIMWMGRSKQPPADRTVHVDHVHAKYMTMVIVFLILALIGETWLLAAGCLLLSQSPLGTDSNNCPLLTGGNLMELVHFHYMPEAGLTMIVGIGVGLLVLAYGSFTHSHHMEELARFDARTFNLVLLPIIIFDAGFGAKKARFFGNLGPIMMCALIGTSISTTICGMGIWMSSDITEVEMGFSE